MDAVAYSISLGVAQELVGEHSPLSDDASMVLDVIREELDGREIDIVTIVPDTTRTSTCFFTGEVGETATVEFHLTSTGDFAED